MFNDYIDVEVVNGRVKKKRHVGKMMAKFIADYIGYVEFGAGGFACYRGIRKGNASLFIAGAIVTSIGLNTLEKRYFDEFYGS